MPTTSQRRGVGIRVASDREAVSGVVTWANETFLGNSVDVVFASASR